MIGAASTTGLSGWASRHSTPADPSETEAERLTAGSLAAPKTSLAGLLAVPLRLPLDV
jgi:hypothetical protein